MAIPFCMSPRCAATCELLRNSNSFAPSFSKLRILKVWLLLDFLVNTESSGKWLYRILYAFFLPFFFLIRRLRTWKVEILICQKRWGNRICHWNAKITSFFIGLCQYPIRSRFSVNNSRILSRSERVTFVFQNSLNQLSSNFQINWSSRSNELAFKRAFNWITTSNHKQKGSPVDAAQFFRQTS